VPVPSARRAALRRRLLAWYDAHRRALPWRFPQRGADPYRVWLAEVMLQQTQVAAVVPYFERFVARFPTLEALSRAREDDVLALWSGLGYYARARNLRVAARAALARHGRLPASLEALRALPGFGPYTAGAVASIAFAIRAPAVDGNVARVLARVFLVEGDPAAGAVRERLWALAGALVPEDRPGDLNQALMELGATVCRKPTPACARCPIVLHCAAHASGRVAEIPVPRRRRARVALRLACGVARKDGAILLVRAPRGGLFAGLWQLPAAEVGPGADGALALRDALRARFGDGAAVGPLVARAERVLTHRALTLEGYACRVPELAKLSDGARFTPPAEIATLGVSTAMRALLAELDTPAARLVARRRWAAQGGKGSSRDRARARARARPPGTGS
jgi:A/G-specific adenine glycosylase